MISRKITLGLVTVAGVVAMSVPGAFADTLAYDGDGVAPITGNAVAFGAVCTGTVVTKNVLLAANRTSNGNGNIFQNSSTVTFSVVSATTGLTASIPSTANTVTLPSNWATQQDEFKSGAVNAQVRYAPTGAAYSGSVTLRATGTNLQGNSHSKDTIVPVTAGVGNCDSTAPTLSLPNNLTQEAIGATGAVVTYSATASDANPASPTVSCDKTSGSTFPLGTTTVNCSATDAANNTARGSFTVTVEDTTRPEVAQISNLIAQEASSGSGATVTYTTPSATDAVSSNLVVSCAPASGTTFALGTTQVTCSATDGAGNTGSSRTDVIVQDTTKPVLSIPRDVTEEATSANGALVSWEATATDTVDPNPTVSCDPASGSQFALTSTLLAPATVSCSATDASNNTATGSFPVTVQDTTAPALAAHGDEIAEATSASGATVNYAAPTATDAVDATPAVSCLPASGSTFALGTTPVTCTATDDANNSSTSSFDVIVQDTTRPALTLPTDQVLTATSSNGAAATFAASATDRVDATPTVSCNPASGSTFAIGASTVTCTATDDSGNTASGTFEITVKRDLKGFYQPVDMWRTLNTVKAGATVPLKFEVFAGSHEYTDTSIIKTLSVKSMNCTTFAAADELEQTATGGTSLRYDTTGGQYVYNWQTPKQVGTCYLVRVTTTDGAQVNAQFKLR